MDRTPVCQGQVAFCLYFCPCVINVRKPTLSNGCNLNSYCFATTVIDLLNVANFCHWFFVRIPATGSTFLTYTHQFKQIIIIKSPTVYHDGVLSDILSSYIFLAYRIIVCLNHCSWKAVFCSIYSFVGFCPSGTTISLSSLSFVR